MNHKKLLCGSLAIGVSLAAARLLFTKAATGKPDSTKPTSTDASYAAIDAYIEEQMRHLHIPGASLAIVKGKKIVHRRGFGQAHPAGDVPTPQTPFFIGSLTKSITALAIMQLVEAGKVELDAPVQRYLPWFRVADPEASARMTVRHLLNQTSGLPVMASQLILADLDNRPGAAERQIRALSTLKLSHPVGEKVEYCNLNFNILGLIIETASGETYADYVQKHIFDPLRMNHSYSSKAEAQRNGLAMGHRLWFGHPVPAPDLPIPLGSLASGQLISCAEDMSHYLIAHLNSGRYGEAQILSSAGMDELHRGVLEYINFGISSGFYAMGWFDLDIGKTKTLSHGGNVPEFSAFMSLVPEQKKGMVVLFNCDPFGLPMLTDEIGLNLTAILAGQQPAPLKMDFVQWIFRLLPLIPLLQLKELITTLHKYSQWQRAPSSRPSAGRIWTQHILLSLFPNLTLAAIWAYLQSSGLLGFIRLYMPDLAWIARICGGFAGVWAILRTRLIWQTLRKTTR